MHFIVYHCLQNTTDATTKQWKEIFNDCTEVAGESGKNSMYNLGIACIDLCEKYYNNKCNSVIINDKVISLFLTPKKDYFICSIGESHFDIDKAYSDFLTNFIEFNIDKFIHSLINLV